jgi:hypothetical protein
VQGSATSITKEDTFNNRLRATKVGALTILGTFAPSDQKSRMMVINMDQLAPYQRAARDEWP